MRVILAIALCVVVVLLVLVVWLARAKTEWVAYVPLEYDEHSERLVQTQEEFTSLDAKAVVIVLTGYGEPFQYSPDPPYIWITRKLASDADLVWNFTTKASDLRARGEVGALISKVGGGPPENSVLAPAKSGKEGSE